MAKISITAVVETCVTPSIIIDPVSSPCPERMEKTSGTKTSAGTAVIRRVMTRIMKTVTIEKPRIAGDMVMAPDRSRQ
jgi:hypothetical protein